MLKTFILWLLPFCCCAQSIYPTLSGTDLLDAVATDYKPLYVLDYDEARDVMYGEIYNVNDSVTCVYTGHTLPLPTSGDPSVHLYMNGSGNGINTEHTYPQSKGASEANGNAHSNLHHLFPTRAGVNSARNNYPFAEIPDSQTENWYYQTSNNSQIPNNNRDDHSERQGERFEPREDHKGNAARAVFYFYTMYEVKALAADPDYFESQRETLCDWHFLDPVDELELERTYYIAGYQSDLPNPFVVDESVALRSYCADLQVALDPAVVQTLTTAYPNPVTNHLTVTAPGVQSLRLTDITGREMFSSDYIDTATVDMSRFPKGTYLLFTNSRVLKIVKF